MRERAVILLYTETYLVLLKEPCSSLPTLPTHPHYYSLFLPWTILSESAPCPSRMAWWRARTTGAKRYLYLKAYGLIGTFHHSHMEMRSTPKEKTNCGLFPLHILVQGFYLKHQSCQVYLSEFRSAEIPQLCLPFLFSGNSSLARSEIPSKILKDKPLLPLPGRKDKHL